MGENLAQVPELKAGQDVILPIERPIKPTGHIQILYGNLAPKGSVAKITGGHGPLDCMGLHGTAKTFQCMPGGWA